MLLSQSPLCMSLNSHTPHEYQPLNSVLLSSTTRPKSRLKLVLFTRKCMTNKQPLNAVELPRIPETMKSSPACSIFYLTNINSSSPIMSHANLLCWHRHASHGSAPTSTCKASCLASIGGLRMLAQLRYVCWESIKFHDDGSIEVTWQLLSPMAMGKGYNIVMTWHLQSNIPSCPTMVPDIPWTSVENSFLDSCLANGTNGPHVQA